MFMIRPREIRKTALLREHLLRRFRKTGPVRCAGRVKLIFRRKANRPGILCNSPGRIFTEERLKASPANLFALNRSFSFRAQNLHSPRETNRKKEGLVAHPHQESSRPYNHLIHEKSPYLLQHADNPVAWYPWNEEAFRKAREEDKPIFLSIGYATCHWCHVMAHESFEDGEVAEVLNQSFVSIKVDREGGPDIDQIYMSVCQALTGQGGWPLSIFMTPEGNPFFAGTYFPKTSRMGQPGFIDLLTRISNLWQTDREKILQGSAEIRRGIQKKERGG